MTDKELAVFPGSFDPVTNGHIDIITRGLKIFEKVLVAVLNNPNKHTLLSVEDRVALVRDQFASYEGRVEDHSLSGLLVDFLKTQNAKVIVRGLRAISDFEYENQLALMNRSIGDVETCFLVASEENSFISSSLVKQVASFGGDVTKFVPSHVAAVLAKAYAQIG